MLSPHSASLFFFLKSVLFPLKGSRDYNGRIRKLFARILFGLPVVCHGWPRDHWLHSLSLSPSPLLWDWILIPLLPFLPYRFSELLSVFGCFTSGHLSGRGWGGRLNPPVGKGCTTPPPLASGSQHTGTWPEPCQSEAPAQDSEKLFLQVEVALKIFYLG